MGRPPERDRGCLGGSRRAEAGNALVDVVYGEKDPSGRLVSTIAPSPSGYHAQCVERRNTLNITYYEGLFVDYRHFGAANMKPRFESGFGLGYTRFDYSGLNTTAITSLPDQDTQLEANWQAGPALLRDHRMLSGQRTRAHRNAYLV